MKLSVALLFFLVVFVSCKSDQQSQNQTGTSTPSDTVVTSKTNAWQAPQFSTKAREAVNAWKNFREFENSISYLNQVEIKNISSETKRMTEISDTLLMYIPKAINSSPIASRMRVLKTRVYLFDELASRHTVKKEVVKNYLNEMNTAYTNLVLKINEKFEKEEIDAMTKTQQNLQTSKQQNDSI